MNNAGKEYTAYREFEVDANRDPKDSYSPVRFGGFEWLEGKPNFKDSCLRCSRTHRGGCWNTHAKLHNSRTFGAAFVSITNCVGGVFPLYFDAYCDPRFAPLDLPNARTVEDLLALYKLYSIPGAFVSERLHHVAHSFGSAQEKNGSSCTLLSIRVLMWAKKLDSWFHFLCKNVPVEEVNGVKHIGKRNLKDKKDFSQADFSWVRSAYCLKAKPPSQTTGWREVTLIAFGGEMLLWEKFDALSNNTSCQDILEDPYCLINVVFEVLYARIDRIAWDLADVYSQEEEVRDYRT